MKLTCKLGLGNQRIITVDPDDQLYTLIEKLNIKDPKTNLIFQGIGYTVASILTFKQIGMTSDTLVYFNIPVVAGKNKN